MPDRPPSRDADPDLVRLAITFAFMRLTTNKVRFRECCDLAQVPAVGDLYLHKGLFLPYGPPGEVRVAVEFNRRHQAGYPGPDPMPTPEPRP